MQVPSTPRWQRILGIVLTVLPAGMLLLSASAKLTAMPEAVEGFKQFGFPDGALFKIGIVEVLCVLLFVIPQTAILGAILIAAYLGGAVILLTTEGKEETRDRGMQRGATGYINKHCGPEELVSAVRRWMTPAPDDK
jgi:uncharacterized membrane protein YphA (DoxX/SURF4 family)